MPKGYDWPKGGQQPGGLLCRFRVTGCRHETRARLITVIGENDCSAEAAMPCKL